LAGPSPTVGQRRLARVLRRLRADAGLTIDQVAKELELSPSTISRMETALVAIRRRDVRELLNIYGVTGVQREELLQLAQESRKEAWWQEYKDLPNVPLPGLEAEAASISQFSALVVPGLLQTEEYARVVLKAFWHEAGPDDIERRLRLRMDRQGLLVSQKSPRYWAILDEAALWRTIGGRQVMQKQLECLISATERQNVTIQVLPFTAGAHAGIDGEFTILSYRNPGDPDVVYIENTGGDAYIENSSVTHRYNSIFDELRAAALNQVESVRTLTKIKESLPELERG
jgi:transcriptional regulator with XRE-family HTH domain